MFNTPPPSCSNRLPEKTVCTRGAYKRNLAQLINTQVREIKSDVIKTNPAQKCAPDRAKTDCDTIKKSLHGSKNTGSNMSIEARKKQLQYESAKAMADIDKKLLEKKLAADIAALESRSGRSDRSSKRDNNNSVSRLNSKEKVEQWLDRSHIEGNPAPPPEHAVSNSFNMHNLVSAIHETNLQNKQFLSRFAASKDLPQFHGDPLEWLAFKQAYDESSRVCNYSESENLWRLRKSLRGEAKETVSSLLIGSTASHTVIQALELRYGRPEIIINRITQQLKKLPSLSNNFHQDIVSFSIKIKNFVAVTQSVQQKEYLCSPELVTLVLSKCPSILLNKWADYYSLNQYSEKAKLELIADFLYSEAQKISIAGLSHIYSQADTKKRPEDRRSHSVLLSDKDAKASDVTSKCKFCHLSSHKLSECARFKRALTRDRWRFVRTQKLCHKCLVVPHDRDTCSAAPFDVETCGLPHHRLLHWKPKSNVQAMIQSNEKLPNNNDNVLINVNKPCSSNSTESNETVTHINKERSCVFLKVVPVTIHGPSGKILTHALLDDGATISLMAADIAERVGLHGRKQVLSVQGAWDTKLTCESQLVHCKITNQNNEVFALNVRKINELNLPLQKLSNIQIQSYDHLNKLNKSIVCRENVKPKILIGQDNYDLIAPIKTITRKRNEPCATLTPLGWCVHGVCPRFVQSDRIMLSSIQRLPAAATGFEPRNACIRTADNTTIPLSTAHTDACERTYDSPSHGILCTSALAPATCSASNNNSYTIHTDPENDAQLHELVRKFFMFESIGVNTKPRSNKNDLRATEMLEKSANLINGKWGIGLPWKDEKARMVDSFGNAWSRLMAMERRMKSDTDFGIRYRERINHLFVNRYARELETDKDANKIWFLSHFGVDNNNKKKLRAVFDAAATSAGLALNDYLLKGPDLLESLLGIMFRFRELEIGLTGDIKEFFLQIKIKPEDQHALRFIWRDLYLRKMWRTARRLADMYWLRWVKEYLPTLLPRQKWYKEANNLQPDDVVIVIDPNLPRNTWLKGRILKVFPGADGRVRTVEVETKTGILIRPLTRLALLPKFDECPRRDTGRRM